jgi:hypothetical protein
MENKHMAKLTMASTIIGDLQQHTPTITPTTRDRHMAERAN